MKMTGITTIVGTLLALFSAGLAQASSSVESAPPAPRIVPSRVPTEGEVWPLPQQQARGSQTFNVDPATLTFIVDGATCPRLDQALERAMEVIRGGVGNKQQSSSSDRSLRDLEVVSVVLSSPCEDLPYLYMDEAYDIEITVADAVAVGSITSNSIWGMLHGIESFLQLLVPNGASYSINDITISDYPRFPYRGFMLDTSRHYLPVSSIIETLDLMSMNKFNVLHWHIVDDDSFPYQSTVFPDLSIGGAWSPAHIFTVEDISFVVNYAADRGIRVVPEFDTPGHTLSWGPGQPGLLTPCYSDGVPDGSFGPIDPTKEESYQFLTELFTEVADPVEHFADHYIHLGGDEVPFGCWQSNPYIADFMVANNMTTIRELEDYYFARLLPIISGLPTQNGYIVWQEVFDNGVNLAADTIVHVWKDEDNPAGYLPELERVTAAGFQALLSSCWYLNLISYGIDWHKYYECDPLGFDGTQAQKDLVMGGEACMWGEWVDRTNLIPTTWPRASAVAERLWSNPTDTTSAAEAESRLEEHRCRMYNRGHMVRPLWPSFCDGDLD